MIYPEVKANLNFRGKTNLYNIKKSQKIIKLSQKYKKFEIYLILKISYNIN